MNEIEKRFYDAFVGSDDPNRGEIRFQEPVGIYFVDFIIYGAYQYPLAIEIDGQESHKTKEQRYYDCKRGRFLLKEGYVVARFTASEVYVDAQGCVKEALEISCAMDTTLRGVIEENLYITRCMEESKEGV